MSQAAFSQHAVRRPKLKAKRGESAPARARLHAHTVAHFLFCLLLPGCLLLAVAKEIYSDANRNPRSPATVPTRMTQR